MKKVKRIAIWTAAVLAVAALCVCIWGIPLNGVRFSVHGGDDSGTFTGTWSPIKGSDGVFVSDEGWTFDGHINPDGGLFRGQLTNYPLPPRDDVISEWPEIYNGAVDENCLVDLEPIIFKKQN